MKDFFKLPRNPKVDKEAWLRSCLLKNESGLIRYVKSLIYNLETSQEIVQDSFLKLWEQDYEKVAGFETPWLFATCRNKAYDYLKSRKNKNVHSDEVLATVVDTSPNSEESLMNRHRDAQVEEMMSMLTAEQKEILNLKFQHGLSYKDISAVTGQSVSHVGVIIHKAVSLLKEKAQQLEKAGGRP